MKLIYIITFISLIINSSFAQSKITPESTEVWEPQPKIITPGSKPGEPPSDALVLFDGKSLDQWESEKGGPAPWKIQNGFFTVTAGASGIKTKDMFGDIQLHIEWKTPPVTDSTKVSQGRGNSGIFLQERYEVQVLDNYKNKTYANGQASSIYKQHIPLVNACKKPDEWQTYDIFYTAPRFNEDGRVIQPAYVTVIHNGVLTQHHVALWGSTEYEGFPLYKKHGKASLYLQDHGNPVSYRNIWVRRI